MADERLTRSVNPGDGVTVKLGPLIIEVNDMGHGKVTYEGRRLPLLGFTVRVRAGHLVEVSVEPSTLGAGDEAGEPSYARGRGFIEPGGRPFPGSQGAD